MKLNEWLVGGNNRSSPSKMPTSSDASGQRRSVVVKNTLKKANIGPFSAAFFNTEVSVDAMEESED